jgi:hypothetical protein
MGNDRRSRFLPEFRCTACVVNVGVCDDNGLDILNGQAQLRKHLFHSYGGPGQPSVD